MNASHAVLSITYIRFIYLISFAGLQVRVKGDETLRTYKYVWAPVAQTTCHINWTPLTKNEVTCQHIHCHQLQEAMNVHLSLNDLLISCPSMVALLIINTKNNYNIEDSLPRESEMSPFPILIVTSETGKALSDLLDAGGVEAKTELPASLSVGSEPVKAEVEDSFIEISTFMFGFLIYHYCNVSVSVFKQHILCHMYSKALTCKTSSRLKRKESICNPSKIIILICR